MTALRIGGLFAGYSGLERGVQAVLGGEIAWHSEIDPGACKILAHRYPDVPNLGDITQIDWSQVEPVDVLTGGSPCQDVSAAGKRAGMRAGTRSGLWASMCDAIEIIRPRLVVWENVRGVLSAHADSAVEPCPICVGDERDAHLRALGRVVGDLDELGYVGRWIGLRASDVGAPHGRFRVFLAAWPADTDGAGSQGAQPATRRHLSDWGAAANAARYGRHQGWTQSARFVGGSDAAERGHASPHAGRARLGEHPGGPPAEEARPAGGDQLAGDRGPRAAVDWGPYQPAIARWERVLGRPAPSPTEFGAKGNARLSPRFVEWLMGLPAGWVTEVPGLSRNDQLKCLGNGVVAQQCAAALRMLLADRLDVAA